MFPPFDAVVVSRLYDVAVLAVVHVWSLTHLWRKLFPPKGR
jgi:hypothetical protein